MEFKYAFQKLMAEHKLEIKDLPEDAREGIKSIMEMDRAITLAESKNKVVRPDTLSKVKRNDKWVVREILDYLQDKDDDHGPLPNPTADVIKEIKDAPIDDTAGKGDPTEPAAPKKDPEPTKNDPPVKKDDETQRAIEVDPKGLKIDEELAKMFETGKTQYTLEEVKANAKNAYDVVFDNYEEGGENGVETSKFILSENKDKTFTLKQL